MNEIFIREAVDSDAAGIQSVGLLTWPTTYLPFTSAEYVIDNINTWWTRESVLFSIREERTFVATLNDRIVGVTVLGRFEDSPVIWKLYVLPEFQRLGIAKRLMDFTLRYVPENSHVRLEYTKGNLSAKAFYEKYGFEHDFIEPSPDGFPAVWMRLTRK